MITLSGLPYRAASPSHFEQAGSPVTIAFDGTSWLIAVHGVYGMREFKTRDEASDLIATSFINAHRENLA
jgi:hypothetical protein